MRIVRRHAGHAMTQERLPDFVIHTDTLQSRRKRMPQVVKVEVVNPDPATGFTPIFLECSLMSPTAEYATIGKRRNLSA
nr:hypothetical protein [Nitrospira sp. ND1]